MRSKYGAKKCTSVRCENVTFGVIVIIANIAMERILQQLNMGTLLVKFQAERMDPSTVSSLSDTELARLGVAMIGDRIQLRELCKEAEENAHQPQPTRVSAEQF